jgi:hypothetical protein
MSHFATAFFVGPGRGIVISQKFSGFKIEWLPYFLKKNKVIYALKPKDISRESSISVMRALMQEFSGTNYDDGGFAYFAYRAALLKIFKKPLPKRGKWGNKRDPLCTGHARIQYKYTPQLFSKPVSDFDITTPGALYKNMLGSGKFNDATKLLTSS